MKKLTAFLLAFLLLFACCVPSFAEEDAAADDGEEIGFFDAEDAEEEDGPAAPAYSYDTLRVGNPTRMKGDFFTDMWGNATSDLDVRALIHGYDLILWDGGNGMFIANPSVVNGLTVLDNALGERTYSFSLYDDLFYSDGTPITARDYAFSLLFAIDPVVEELGGKPLRKEYLWGFAEYLSGRTKALGGVHVVSDTRLDITVRHEYLPFFYELGLLSCLPYPIHVIAPGCEVRDDGEGAYLKGDMTAELLRRTVLDPDTGYRSHPAVTCGPYVLTGFDGTTATFAVNAYFKGDAEGIKPAIPRLEYTLADNETMVEQLGSAEFGLLNKVSRGEAILQGMGLIGTGLYDMTNYPRSGLTFISFNCEKAAVSSQAVRQAIACCVDKDQLVMDYVGNFGMRVEGFYGLGQWMYQILSGTMAYPEPEEETETDPEALAAAYEELIARWSEAQEEMRAFYALSPEHAVQLLESDGWTLNREGEAFRPGVDAVRCKQTDGGLIALELSLAYPDGNRIAQSMEGVLIPALAGVGVSLRLEPVEMTALLDMFYGRVERSADMLYLGTDFDVVFDPSAHFIPNEEGGLTWNYTGAADEELYGYAVAMRMTEPGDVLTYLQNWISFQQRFSELQPMIPIYSNVYFDFYSRVLHNYILPQNITWTQAIVRAYLSDIEDEEEEAEDEEDDFGDEDDFEDDFEDVFEDGDEEFEDDFGD